MELACNWRLFQSVFHPSRKGAISSQLKPEGASLSPAMVVLDQERIVAAFCEGEDLSTWVGQSRAELESQVRHRDWIAFERAQVDEWMREAAQRPRFYDQVECLRERAKPVKLQSTQSQPQLSVKEHFLIELLKSRVQHYLPRSYAIYVDLHQTRLLLTVRNGRFESFHEPDLNALDANARKDLPKLQKHLASRYFVPVFIIRVASSLWDDWSRSSSPWKSIIRSLKNGEARVYPESKRLSLLLRFKSF